MTSLADIDAAMAAGATRVGINSAAVKNPDLLRQGVEKYGKDAISFAALKRDIKLPKELNEIITLPNRHYNS